MGGTGKRRFDRGWDDVSQTLNLRCKWNGVEIRQEFENGPGQRERCGSHLHRGLSEELASPEMGRGLGGGARKPACGEWLGAEAGAGRQEA